MTIFAGIGLDELVRVEDALDAIVAGRTTRQEYIECNKSQVQPLYATAWDCAQDFIQQFGTARKALNQVHKGMARGESSCCRYSFTCHHPLETKNSEERY